MVGSFKKSELNGAGNMESNISRLARRRTLQRISTSSSKPRSTQCASDDGSWRGTCQER